MYKRTNLAASGLDELLLDIHVKCNYMHVVEQKDLWESEIHTHENLEIGYIYRGTGRYHIGGTDYEAKTGDVFVIPPGVPHFEINYPDLPFEIMFLQTEHYGGDTHALYGIVKQLQGQIHLNQDRKVKAIFDDVYDEVVMQSAGYLSFIDSRLKSLYVLLYRHKFAPELTEPAVRNRWTGDERNRFTLEKVRQYVLDNLEKKCTTESIANQFFYHPKYLSQIIKKETGQNLSDYILTVRIEKAKEWLVHSDMQIKDISDRLGFSSVQHFYKTFKKELDMTPKHYRSVHFLNPGEPD